MNIIFRELKANRKSLIIWSIFMLFLVVSGMYKYTTVYSGGVNAADAFTKLPTSVKALLGFGSFDVTSLSGFFGMLFSYILLAAAIHAVGLGAGIIAKEERDKTTEYLMVKPVSRSRIVTSKLITALFNIIIINLISFVSSAAMVTSFNEGNDLTPIIANFFICMFIVQLVFLSFGAMLAAMLKNPKTSGSLATGILLIAFVISKITDMTSSLNFLNILSPFKYFNYVNIVEGKAVNLIVVILSLLLISTFINLTYFLYRKRDLKC